MFFKKLLGLLCSGFFDRDEICNIMYENFVKVFKDFNLIVYINVDDFMY